PHDSKLARLTRCAGCTLHQVQHLRRHESHARTVAVTEMAMILSFVFPRNEIHSREAEPPDPM
ncbi:MAG: hypothetical protein RL685_469, partial [Pseudomonadota bacterium]